MKKQQGFTLIEIAIVLVIIGLLLGGVLKGQELINAARVRNIAAQVDGVKIAYLAFQDRYRALPGDMPDAIASTSLPQVNGAAAPGCGVAGNNCGNGTIDPPETLLVWAQLAASGFITGSYAVASLGTDTGTTAPTPTAATAPTNAFSGFIELVNDADYLDANTAALHTNIKTGANVPVGILLELDTKIDDGLPVTGQFRESAGTWDHTTPTPGCATTATAAATYNAAVGTQNCGGVALQ
jgi:prepilin-type N-terminal cleavage/methylation domain-containing protein